MSMTTTMSVTVSMTTTVTVSVAMTSGWFCKIFSLYLDGNIVDTVFFDLKGDLLQDSLWVITCNDLGNKNVLASAETPTVELL